MEFIKTFHPTFPTQNFPQNISTTTYLPKTFPPKTSRQYKDAQFNFLRASDLFLKGGGSWSLYPCMPHIHAIYIPLMFELDSARFEFTLKIRLNRIWPKDLTYAIFLKSWVFKDVKYDIPMCKYHSTRPQPIQLVPTMQKMHFTLSFQPKFLKIWFTKVAATSIKSYIHANFFVPQSQVVPGACFGP